LFSFPKKRGNFRSIIVARGKQIIFTDKLL
jgi:hypothetical protein